MAWIEVHQALVNHRKTMRLAGALKCSRPQAVGHLVSLWLWALDNVDEDGLMAECSADEVSMAAGWDGDSEVFFDAMVRAGFLEMADGEVSLHDWGDYGGKLSTRRAANRARMRETREQARATNVQRTGDAQPESSTHVQRTTDERATDVQDTDAERVGLQYSTQQYPTQPNTTVPDSTDLPPHAQIPASPVLKELYGDLTTTKSDQRLRREVLALESEFADLELDSAVRRARASGIGCPWPRQIRENMPKSVMDDLRGMVRDENRRERFGSRSTSIAELARQQDTRGVFEDAPDSSGEITLQEASP